MKLPSHIAIKFGLIMTGLNAAYILLMHFSGQYGPEYSVNPLDLVFIVVVPLIVWFFGIQRRKEEKKGSLKFREGFVEGIHISLVYGIVSPFVYAFYYLLLNPGILSSLKTEYGMKGVSDIQIVLLDMLAQFVSAVIFGTIYAAIVSYILKSKSTKK